MSTCPLDEPHLDALRWACDLATHDPDYAEQWRKIAPPPGECGKRTDALRALSSPASAASLVRDLLERAGVASLEAICFGEAPFVVQVHIENGGSRVIHSCLHAPGLISALADLAPGDKEGAMRALREVGR